MKHRISTLLAAAALGLGLSAQEAMAHGGQFRGPQGAVPPGMRLPSDPTPGTPDPRAPGDPVSGPVTGGGTGPSLPSSPDTGNPTPPPLSGGTPRSGRPGAPSMDFSDASFWWGYNSAPYMQLKRAIYHSVGTGNPLGHLGGSSGRSDSTLDVRALTQKTLVPALLWAMDPANKTHPDVESAAYIGLAKVTKSPADIDRLRHGLSLTPRSKRDVIVRESAALALGLIRRSARADQFLPAELDRVRDTLFDVFENAEHATRVRGFAALSIGLLGDQPTGTAGATGEVATGKATTARLFELLGGSYASADLHVALLMAIGMQDVRTFNAGQRDVLNAVVLKGRLPGQRQRARGIVRAHAAHALGQVGTARAIRTLQLVMRPRSRNDRRVMQSAAIGLGELSRQVSGADRVDLVAGMLKTLENRLRDQSTRGFAFISIGHAIAEDLKANRTDILDKTDAEEVLLRTVERGRRGDRNYAGLALAIIAREIGDEPITEKCGELRSAIFQTLGAALNTKKFDPRERANFATALGMSGSITHGRQLHAIVKDRTQSHELRGYAALGLGLLRDDRRSVRASIRLAMEDRRSEEMRVLCATALGLLHDKSAVPLLIDELNRSRSASAKGQIVLALARIGDERAIGPLVGILRDANEQQLTRAVSCAALGIVGDMELLPSLSRISINVNYRASSDLSREILSIL